MLHVYADGAKGVGDRSAVTEVRRLVRSINWCEVEMVERETNWGLGRNVLDGVSRTAERCEAFIVWEDDLVCIPQTYAWLSGALRHYVTSPGVMSVTAWSHPRVKPDGIDQRPYFDGRAECWVWGAWSRSWRGMTEQTALQKLHEVEARGIAADAYGSDLPAMARAETGRNIWAVRWLYHHLQHGGLCLRPPRPWVRHIGFDAGATNADDPLSWENYPIEGQAALPSGWPKPIESPDCRTLWQLAYPKPSWLRRVRNYAGRLVRRQN